jgi:hypothetical protein
MIGWITMGLALALIACGSSSGSPAEPPSSTGFAGTYATHVTLKEDACGAITVQDNATTVTYAEATRAVTFTHAGTTYSGSVAADSTFTTEPRSVSVGDGYSYEIALAGRFGNASFEADATVDRTGMGDACRFVVHWAGSK